MEVERVCHLQGREIVWGRVYPVSFADPVESSSRTTDEDVILPCSPFQSPNPEMCRGQLDESAFADHLPWLVELGPKLLVAVIIV